jgi:hypothetical protein
VSVSGRVAAPPSSNASRSASATWHASPTVVNAATAALAVRLAEHAMDELTTLPRLHPATRATHSAPSPVELSVVRWLWTLLSEHTRSALRQVDGMAVDIGACGRKHLNPFSSPQVVEVVACGVTVNCRLISLVLGVHEH